MKSTTFKLAFFAISLMLFTACHKSLREHAVEEAQEYTRKFCPTPDNNHVRTDSAVFNIQTDEYIYYCTLTSPIDSREFVDFHRKEITQNLRLAIRQSIPLKRYKDAGFKFRYICRSAAQPNTIWLNVLITPDDYQ